MSHYQNQEKKGLVEKIKEKIPGVGRKQGHTTSTTNPYQQGHTTSTTAPGHYEGQHHQGKKGLTEKIKENIPGVGHKQGHTTSTTTEKIKENIPGIGHKQGHTTSTTAPGHYGGQHHQQKKGVMEKIKEKLPGHH